MRISKISFACGALLLMAAFVASSASAATLDVSIINFAFVPQTVTIKAGDTVRWTNMDVDLHTATADSGVWGSPLLAQNDTWEFTFTQAMSHPYHCVPHPFMTGTVIVEASLTADTTTIPENVGGQVNFKLDGGTSNAGRTYLMLGCLSGSSPGIPLPGGLAVLPVNWDIFTSIVVSLLNTPVFKDFQGNLDGSGLGKATMNLGPIPGAAGFTMSFAYAVVSPWDFASNPVDILIVP
jgi:plastocyanin